MKRIGWQLSLALLWLCALAQPAHAVEKIRVVTTITDLAEFARAVGGDLVDVHSLATGVEDPHGIPMKPSFIPLLNRADLIVLVGLGLEHAFLPALLDASRNPKILKGRPGYIDCSRNVYVLEVPRSLDKSEGDVHPVGNSHINLDPMRAKTMVQNIYEGLSDNFPEHQAEFAKNRDAYLAKLDAKIAEWQTLAAPLKGVQFVSYHLEWPYFSERFGLIPFGTVELKPGIDPTPRHIEELIEAMKANNVRIVVREPQFPEKVPSQIAARTGARLIKLPIMVGGVPEAKTYFDMIDYDIRTLLKAAQPG